MDFAAETEHVGIKMRGVGMEPERGVCDKGRHEELENRMVKGVVKNKKTECILLGWYRNQAGTDG